MFRCAGISFSCRRLLFQVLHFLIVAGVVVVLGKPSSEKKNDP